MVGCGSGLLKTPNLNQKFGSYSDQKRAKARLLPARVDSFVFRILENVMRNEFRISWSNPVEMVKNSGKGIKMEEKARQEKCAKPRLKGKKIEEKIHNFT